MPRPIRHDVRRARTSETSETLIETALRVTLGSVRRANLRGSLYLPGDSLCARGALQLLRAAGAIERVAPTATSPGGWFVCVTLPA